MNSAGFATHRPKTGRLFASYQPDLPENRCSTLRIASSSDSPWYRPNSRPFVFVDSPFDLPFVPAATSFADSLFATTGAGAPAAGEGEAEPTFTGAAFTDAGFVNRNTNPRPRTRPPKPPAAVIVLRLNPTGR